MRPVPPVVWLAGILPCLAAACPVQGADPDRSITVSARADIFVTTKHREQQFEARKLAVEHAKEKAAHLTELNGLKLGKAIRIEESVEGDIHTEGFGFGGMAASDAGERPGRAKIHLVAADLPATKRGEKPPAAPRKPIAPGQLTISATVTITFELTE